MPHRGHRDRTGRCWFIRILPAVARSVTFFFPAGACTQSQMLSGIDAGAPIILERWRYAPPMAVRRPPRLAGCPPWTAQSHRARHDFMIASSRCGSKL
ncbi:hypothetical protein BC628DRAFT_584919 [Trametes gibbosa]|nr:hypothetical protein BC628DRAFT_584919 [Trametes gibbosa]